MYAWTGPSPSALAIWGFPPDRRTAFAGARSIAPFLADLPDFFEVLLAMASTLQRLLMSA
jgi:hypothetical protein